MDKKDNINVEGRIPHPTDVPIVDPKEVKVEESTGGYSRNKQKPSKQVLKTDVVAEAITGNSASSAALAAPGMMAMKMGSYSGNEAAFTGQAAETPVRDERTRGRSRFQKKKARVSQSIDDIPSEQIIQEFETVPDLRTDPSSEEGYNGAIPNNNLRIQKVGGAVPASGNFTRSLDNITRDMVVFGVGQVIKMDKTADYDTPTKTYKGVEAEGADDDGYVTIDDPVYRGNYIPRFLKFKVGSNGKIESLSYVVDDVSTIAEDYEVANAGSQYHKTHINRMEHLRQLIESTAGNEDQNNYNPLSNAIPESSRVLNLLHDIEADTGNHIYMSRRFTQAALSFQLNKKVKDGLHNKRSVNELLRDSIGIRLSSGEAEDGLLAPYDILKDGSDSILAGSPAVIIALMDSITKYNKLSDFLNQPRSFQLLLQQYSQYKDVFSVSSDFVKVVEAHDVFSTIDRDYDPTKPVYSTNAMAVVSPRDWSQMFSIVDGERKQTIMSYAYQDLRTHQITDVAHPLLAGIADFIEELGYKWHSITGGKEITIPIVYSKGFVSTWGYLIQGAMKHIVRNRIDAFKEVIKYEEDFKTKMFSGLTPLGQISENNSQNYVFTDIYTPLQIGRMNKHVAITWQLPELFYPVRESGSKHTYIAPWYFSEHQVHFMTTGLGTFSLESEYMNTNFPESRNGVRFGALDAVYNLTPQELRLDFDQMLYPVKRQFADNDIYVHKYDQSMSGGLAVVLDDSEMTPIKILSTPRTVGLFAVAPAGYLTPVFSGYTDVLFNVVPGYLPGDKTSYGFSSYIAKMYFNGKAQFAVKGSDAPINAKVDLNVKRAANFTQEWAIRPAIRLKEANRVDTGFVLGIADLFDGSNLAKGTATFIPFVEGYLTDGAQSLVKVEGLRLASFQKAFWTRLNLIEMAISPWDAVAGGITVSDDGVKVDPYDLLYYFNFAGFRASSFQEAHDNRIALQNALGYGYLTDYYAEKTPILI